MNINTKTMFFRCILLAVLSVLAGIGCTKKYDAPVVVYMPERIIHEFGDMQEHDIVSWAWIRRGFTLSNCRSLKLEPVMDSSQNPNPAVVNRIENNLNETFKDCINQKGELELIVRANVLDVKVKPGLIKSWFAGFDSMPYIELEIIISDSTTGLPLVKVIHFSRDKKSLKTAVTNILGDLRQFFTTAL